jgi:prepilin-type N-terminal cleavage/methylation domain-containing protein
MARPDPVHAPLRVSGGCRPQPGFTLVEMLITLVLLSMVAAVSFGSLRQVLEARERLRPYLDRSQETTLVAARRL